MVITATKVRRETRAPEVAAKAVVQAAGKPTEVTPSHSLTPRLSEALGSMASLRL